MAQPNVSALTRELAKYPSLDPRAVLAIASHEGLGGGIGDQGTSFGPFQLHYGGAFPSTAPHGAQASQQWAWSPAGLDYALAHIASVASGLKGRAAIEAISRRFERPANPEAEIADALAHYGAPLPAGPVGAPQQAAMPGQPQPSGAPAVRQPNPLGGVLASLVGSTNQMFGLGGSPGFANLLAQALARR